LKTKKNNNKKNKNKNKQQRRTKLARHTTNKKIARLNPVNKREERDQWS